MTTRRPLRHNADDDRDMLDDSIAEHAETRAASRCHGHDLPGDHICTDLCTTNACCAGRTDRPRCTGTDEYNCRCKGVYGHDGGCWS
jgi:hypothetical protein